MGNESCAAINHNLSAVAPTVYPPADNIYEYNHQIQERVKQKTESEREGKG